MAALMLITIRQWHKLRMVLTKSMWEKIKMVLGMIFSHKLELNEGITSQMEVVEIAI